MVRRSVALVSALLVLAFSGCAAVTPTVPLWKVKVSHPPTVVLAGRTPSAAESAQDKADALALLSAARLPSGAVGSTVPGLRSAAIQPGCASSIGHRFWAVPTRDVLAAQAYLLDHVTDGTEATDQGTGGVVTSAAITSADVLESTTTSDGSEIDLVYSIVGAAPHGSMIRVDADLLSAGTKCSHF